jgi:ubiquinone/menaquinone biosynthesis C-methylase UbiE
MSLADGWSKLANDYLSFFHQSTKQFAKDTVDVSGVVAKDGIMILDVACGTGVVEEVIMEKFGPQCDAQVLATDFAQGMVDTVKRRASSDGWTNVQAQIQDAMAMTLPDSSFDAVFCVFGVMLLPEPAKALSEMHRVLVPGGTVSCATWHSLALLPLMTKAVSQTKGVPEKEDPILRGWSDLEYNREQMQAAGFRDVRAVQVSSQFTLDSQYRDDFIDFLPRNPAMKSGMFADFSDDDLSKFKSIMKGIMLETYGDQEVYSFDAAANVTCGTK